MAKFRQIWSHCLCVAALSRSWESSQLESSRCQDVVAIQTSFRKPPNGRTNGWRLRIEMTQEGIFWLQFLTLDVTFPVPFSMVGCSRPLFLYFHFLYFHFMMGFELPQTGAERQLCPLCYSHFATYVFLICRTRNKIGKIGFAKMEFRHRKINIRKCRKVRLQSQSWQS